MFRLNRIVFIVFLLLIVPRVAQATDYEVGPGQPYASIGVVPLASLQPGDTVRIHYRSTPYKEKWVICRQGTAAQPITFTGVPGPNGELPIIEGSGATTAPGLNYWSENRGVVKIGGANTPADLMPKYIVIENLEIRGARSSYTFTDDGGATMAYAANASTIYVEKCENCTIRNNVLHDAGNGFFVASSDGSVSRNIVVERNRIYDGGNVGSIYEHNVYTAAIGIRFEGNFLGKLIAGAGGNNLKDRSAGTVIRYNMIEGGNRQLDLVDGEDAAAIRSDVAYPSTFVYGNVLIEHVADGNRQMVHYGGDSGSTASYRKGTLYFYNNTMVSNRTDRTTLFRASTDEETIDARNNIFYSTAAGSTVSLADTNGVFNLSRNWIKPGWVTSFGSFTGTVNNDGTMMTGSAPGFVDEALQDYHLTSTAQVINGGGNLNSFALPANDVIRQYVKHVATEPRPNDGVFDIGAYEFGGGGNQSPVALMLASPVSGIVPVNVNFSAGSSYDPDGTIASYSWQFGDGATATGLTTTHTYNTVGTYTALLRVVDNAGATGTTTQIITVNPVPPLSAPVLSGSASGSTVNLTWTNPGGTATGWIVERKQGKQWTQIANVSSPSFSESRSRGTWIYRVKAFNATLSSPYSNEVSVRIR
jgi:parallel beta-helix repeat protein